MSTEIEDRTAEFSITAFPWRKADTRKSRTYARENAEIRLELFKLSWTVDTADVSKDMGYTRGTFSGTMGNQPMSGSYTTVWKKDESGKWLAEVDIAAPASGQ